MSMLFFVIADPDLDHPWLAPYFRTKCWEQDGRRYLDLGVLRFQAFLKKYRVGILWAPAATLRVTHDAVFLEKMERETRAVGKRRTACVSSSWQDSPSPRL